MQKSKKVWFGLERPFLTMDCIQNKWNLAMLPRLLYYQLTFIQVKTGGNSRGESQAFCPYWATPKYFFLNILHLTKQTKTAIKKGSKQVIFTPRNCQKGPRSRKQEESSSHYTVDYTVWYYNRGLLLDKKVDFCLQFLDCGSD